MPPLGISYLVSYLQENNLNASIFDMNIDLYNELKNDTGWLWRAGAYEWWVDEEKFSKISELFENYFEFYTQDILSLDVPIIGFSVNVSNSLFSLEMARRIKNKNKNKIIIFGGPVCFGPHIGTFLPPEIINDVVDILVVGEGEETLTELIFNLKNKKKEIIPGAIFIENGRLGSYLPRAPIQELDKIPFPIFKEFYIEKYEWRVLPLLLSRGCISKCSFCNDHRLSYPYRWRSPVCVVEEIKYHLKQHGIHHFSFKDLLCNGNLRILSEFCELIIKERLSITWDSQAVSRRDMDKELLNKMKVSGCHALIFGVESCSDRILKRMKKMFTKEDVAEVLHNTHGLGIKTVMNIIVGFPGETEEDFLETYNFIRENRENIDRIGSLSVCLINAETDLNDRPQDYGLVLSEPPKKRALYWTDIYGSTHELRRERASRIISLLKELNLTYEAVNV
jgi:radical SAM superfamily enzyme YgiQ (UPF0313 family)